MVRKSVATGVWVVPVAVFSCCLQHLVFPRWTELLDFWSTGKERTSKEQ
jgi:hypothetical protein